MRNYSVALIPGDGIGVDVIREGQKVLNTICEIDGGIKLDYKHFDWSCEYYLKHGKMMPDDGLDQLKDFDSIYLGAVFGMSRWAPSGFEKTCEKQLSGAIVEQTAFINEGGDEEKAMNPHIHIGMLPSQVGRISTPGA